jgi:DHHC palmitoyltransferase
LEQQLGGGLVSKEQERLLLWFMKESHRRIGASARRQPEFDPEEVVALYICVLGIAAVLTLTCPVDAGDKTSSSTILWDAAAGSWNVWYLVESGVVIPFIVVAFLAVHGSDPGFLTPAVMAQVEGGIDGTTTLKSLLPEPAELASAATTNTSTNDGNEEQQNTLLVQRIVLHLPRQKIPVTKSQLQQPVDVTDDDSTAPTTRCRRPRRHWCRICHMAPPLRAHHCQICNACVATFDHHCEFVGTCIGERNRARFYYFLVAQSVGLTRCCWVLYPIDSRVSYFAVSSVVQGLRGAEWTWIFRWKVGWNWLLIRVWVAKVYIHVLAVAALFLLALHTGMALTNSTTFEWGNSSHLAYLNRVKTYHLPFHQGGIWRNLKVFGCCQVLRRDATWKPMLWEPPVVQRRTSQPSSRQRHWWRKQPIPSASANGEHEIHMDIKSR